MSILNRRLLSLIRNLSFQYSIFKVQGTSFDCVCSHQWAEVFLSYDHYISRSFFFGSGSHLSSHTVASIVLSAAHVLTVVFGMGTGVTHERIATGNFLMPLASKQ